MPKDMKVGCARPTGGPVGEDVEESTQESVTVSKDGARRRTVPDAFRHRW